MQETIKHVMEAEKKAAGIIAEAEAKASKIINKNNLEISDKINKFREKELLRYNQAVNEAELQKKTAVEHIKTTKAGVNIDTNAVSEEVLKRVLKTVFD